MTANQMRRRRRRRAAAVDRCLRRYYRQVAIEEELAALLPRPDSLREVYLPSKPLHPLGGRERGAGWSVLW